MASEIRGSVSAGKFTSRAGRVLAALALAMAGAACGGGSSSGGSNATGPQLAYSGPTTWTIVGPQGGPFVNSSMVFTLQNTSLDQVSWSASTVPSFVQLDQQSGVLAANSEVDVHANLNGPLANSLPPGMIQETLTFHNGTAPQADIAIDCLLSVASGGTNTELLPTSDYSASGPAGGPFQPASATYNLYNMGTTALNWTTTAVDAWISISPASGQLAAGASIGLDVSIRGNATNSLAVGQYMSSWDVDDGSSGNTLYTRGVTLNVTAATTGGWTIFTPSNDTRTIYVSSSQGNDSNNGLTTSTPKRTIAAGKSLLRTTFPDWLLLKCGDTWDESLGEWEGKSGRSNAERMLISTYGTGDRPLLRTGSSMGVELLNHNNTSSHIAFVGIHFWANTYNGSNGSPNGINWIDESDGLLVEDCMFQAYCVGMVVQGYPVPMRHTNVSIRRNVVVDSYSTAGVYSQGLYMSACDNVLIEENLFDRNGWNDNVPGSTPSWFLHNVYIQDGNTGVVFHGNITAGTDGVQLRTGGDVEDNLFLRNAIALNYGVGNTPALQGITGTVRNNVVDDGGDIGTNGASQGPRGWAFRFSNVAQATVERNVIANNVHGHSPRVIMMEPANGVGGIVRGVQNTTFDNNVFYNWGGSIRIYGNQSQYVNDQFNQNIYQELSDSGVLMDHEDATSVTAFHAATNVFYNAVRPQSTWMQVGSGNTSLATWMADVQDTSSIGQLHQFPDPSRTIATYHGSIGGTATYEAFLAEARLQSKAYWRPAYTADAVNQYIRAGFGL
jgi:hypothetical protein